MTEAAHREALASGPAAARRGRGARRAWTCSSAPAVAFVAPATTPVLDSPEGEAEGLFSMACNLTGQPAVVLPCGTAEACPSGCSWPVGAAPTPGCSPRRPLSSACSRGDVA